jgi:hypothetical protein
MVLAFMPGLTGRLNDLGHRARAARKTLVGGVGSALKLEIKRDIGRVTLPIRDGQ